MGYNHHQMASNARQPPSMQGAALCPREAQLDHLQQTMKQLQNQLSLVQQEVETLQAQTPATSSPQRAPQQAKRKHCAPSDNSDDDDDAGVEIFSTKEKNGEVKIFEGPHYAELKIYHKCNGNGDVTSHWEFAREIMTEPRHSNAVAYCGTEADSEPRGMFSIKKLKEWLQENNWLPGCVYEESQCMSDVVNRWPVGNRIFISQKCWEGVTPEHKKWLCYTSGYEVVRFSEKKKKKEKKRRKNARSTKIINSTCIF